MPSSSYSNDADLWKQAGSGASVLDGSGHEIHDIEPNPGYGLPMGLTPDVATMVALAGAQGPLGLLSPVIIVLTTYGGIRALPRTQTAGALLGALVGYEILAYMTVQQRQRRTVLTR